MSVLHIPSLLPSIKRTLLILITGLLTFQSAVAKQQPGDTITLPPKILKFIPAGYTVLDTATGDLNLDRIQDLVIVLKTPGEDTNERWSNEIIFTYSKTDRTWQLSQVIDKSWSVFNLNKIESVIKTKKDFGIVRFEDFDTANY